MKAITIRQPWASLIAEGFKDVENRPQNWKHRGRIAIHVSQTIDWDAVEHDERVQGVGELSQRGWFAFHQGHVIAVAVLADCHPAWGECCASRWANPAARFHLVLNSVVKLPTPVFASGRLGPWDLPPKAAMDIVSQLAGTGWPGARVPPGVIACGPDGRQQQLPPEDVAVVEEFADSLKRKEER